MNNGVRLQYSDVNTRDKGYVRMDTSYSKAQQNNWAHVTFEDITHDSNDNVIYINNNENMDYQNILIVIVIMLSLVVLVSKHCVATSNYVRQPNCKNFCMFCHSLQTNITQHTNSHHQSGNDTKKF